MVCLSWSNFNEAIIDELIENVITVSYCTINNGSGWNNCESIKFFAGYPSSRKIFKLEWYCWFVLKRCRELCCSRYTYSPFKINRGLVGEEMMYSNSVVTFCMSSSNLNCTFLLCNKIAIRSECPSWNVIISLARILRAFSLAKVKL